MDTHTQTRAHTERQAPTHTSTYIDRQTHMQHTDKYTQTSPTQSKLVLNFNENYCFHSMNVLRRNFRQIERMIPKEIWELIPLRENHFPLEISSFHLDAVADSGIPEINTFFKVDWKSQAMFFFFSFLLLIKHLWNICTEWSTIIF